MSQSANPKRTKDNEARAYGKFLKTSPQKLNLVAQLIRGKKASRALVDLEFSKRRIAKEVRKVLLSAVSNAENNHNLDVDRLVVTSATVGRTLKMKRFHARGRGRAAGVEKKFSNITIIVGEAEEKVKKQKKSSPERAAAAKAAKPKAEKSEKTEKPKAKKSEKKSEGAKA
jgi:large subunit ribosomal protein L22